MSNIERLGLALCFIGGLVVGLGNPPVGIVIFIVGMSLGAL